MALALPDFKDRKCLRLDLCGHIPQEEIGKGEKLPELEKAPISRYKAESGIQVYFGLVLPFPTEKYHIHLRVAVAEAFGKKPPKITAKPQEILDLVKPFLGKKIQTELDGWFRVPAGQVSPLISSIFAETTAGPVQVRTTAGTLSVRGAPLHTINWKLVENGEQVDFVLEAKQTAPFDGSYICDALDLIETAFTGLVVVGARDAK